MAVDNHDDLQFGGGVGVGGGGDAYAAEDPAAEAAALLAAAPPDQEDAMIDDVAAEMLRAGVADEPPVDADAGEGAGGADAAANDDIAAAANDVVMDIDRAPLHGFEWMQALQPAGGPAGGGGGDGGGGGGGAGARASRYCYVCNTVPSDEDFALQRVKALFGRVREMDDERIVDLVYKIYEASIRFTGTRPKPEWTRAMIFEHMKMHNPTPESLIMDAVRVTTAMLRPYVLTARRVNPSTRRELPPDEKHTRACLNVIAMRMRAASQLASILDRATGTT